MPCPDCGQPHDGGGDRCGQCGLRFSVFFREVEYAERLRTDIEEMERLETRRRQEAEAGRWHGTPEGGMRGRSERRRRERLAREEAQRIRNEQEARERADAQLQRQEALAREDAFRFRAEQEHRRRDGAADRRPGPSRQGPSPGGEAPQPPTAPDTDGQSLPSVLAGYLGRTVGMAFDGGKTVESVRLLAVGPDHFQVLLASRGAAIRIPYRRITFVTEGAGGNGTAESTADPAVPMVFQILGAPVFP